MTPLLLVILLVMVSLAIVIILVSSIALQRIAWERDRIKNLEIEHQRRLLANSLDTQERERKRIASDIHDELSSKLSVARLALYKTSADSEALKLEVSELVDQALATARAISYDLYPPLLAEFGLAEAIKDLIHPLNQTRRITLNLYYKAASARLEPTLELHLFRITQELISNALRHSHARHLTIDLKITNGYCVLRVSDDGVGFDADRAKSGWGMQSMESRVQVIKGIHRIRSAPQKGTTTLVIIHKQ